MRRRWRWIVAGSGLALLIFYLMLTVGANDPGWDWVEKLGGKEVPIKGRVEAGGIGTGPYTMEARAYVFEEGRKKSFWIDYHAHLRDDVAKAKAEGRRPDRWLIEQGRGGTVLLAKVRYPNWLHRQLITLRMRLGLGGTSVNTKEVWPPTAYLKEVDF